MRFEVAHRSETELIAVAAPIVVRILDGHVTRATDYERLDAVISEHLADAPLLGLLLILHHGTPTPPPEVRRAGAELLSRHKDRISVVIIALGLGFWARGLKLEIPLVENTLGAETVEIESSIAAGARTLAREFLGLNPEVLIAALDELNSREDVGR